MQELVHSFFFLVWSESALIPRKIFKVKVRGVDSKLRESSWKSADDFGGSTSSITFKIKC